MQQDVFVEQIIKRRHNAMDYLIYVGLIVAFFIVCFAGLFIIPSFGILLIAAAGYGAYWLITSATWSLNTA